MESGERETFYREKEFSLGRMSGIERWSNLESITPTLIFFVFTDNLWELSILRFNIVSLCEVKTDGREQTRLHASTTEHSGNPLACTSRFSAVVAELLILRVFC